jgi:hypothetical protein
MTVTLSTIGSAGLRLDVQRAALPEAGPGGISIWIRELHDGPLCLTLTAVEAQQLAEAIAAVGSA